MNFLDTGIKPIPGFSGYYASTEGNILSKKLEPNRGLWLKPQPDHNGYPTVMLTKDGKLIKKKVHHLILETFVGPRPPNCVACHKDSDRLNNCLLNLTWATRKECVQYSQLNGKMPIGKNSDMSELKKLLKDEIQEVLDI